MGIETVKFRGRHVSARALVFLITGILSIIVYIVLTVVTVASGGAPAIFGTIGLLAAALSLAGVIISAKATGERDIFVSVPIAGMIVNGISFLTYVITYIVGIS